MSSQPSPTAYFQSLLQYAQAGIADVQYRLGCCYDKGDGVTQNEAESVRWFRLAAEQEHEWAQFELGWHYAVGKGVTQDWSEAVRWFREAAEQGNTAAQENLLWCYARGKGVPQDEAETERWRRLVVEAGGADPGFTLYLYYDCDDLDEPPPDWDEDEEKAWTEEFEDFRRKAAEQGDAFAQWEQGNRYARTQDWAEAVRWYRLAAEQGEVQAQYDLALCYDQGKGVAQDKAEATRWYRESAMRAKQGYGFKELINVEHIQFILGTRYALGEGVAQDAKEAACWFHEAAEQGHMDAQYNLALCYDQGEGVAQNTAEALRWYREAAKQGHVEAQLILGVRHFWGDRPNLCAGLAARNKERLREEDVLRSPCRHRELGYHQERYDPDAAATTLSRLTGQEDSPNDLSAVQCYLQGEHYFHGSGERVDQVEAVVQWQMAAQQQYPWAQYRLAQAYQFGWGGLEKDEEAAFAWFMQAAEQGIVDAMREAGKCLIAGRGVARDAAQGADWLRRANLPQAWVLLGQLHERGRGVRQDEDEARRCYETAGETNAQAQWLRGRLGLRSADERQQRAGVQCLIDAAMLADRATGEFAEMDILFAETAFILGELHLHGMEAGRAAALARLDALEARLFQHNLNYQPLECDQNEWPSIALAPRSPGGEDWHEARIWLNRAAQYGHHAAIVRLAAFAA